MITVEIIEASRTDAGVEILAVVDLVRVVVTIPSYVITELLDDARIEYTTRDE